MKAIIRVRGNVKINTDIKRAFKELNLDRVNHLSLIPNLNEFLGQVRKVKDFTTFGEISIETLSKLLSRKGRLEGDKNLDEAFLKSNGLTSFTELAEKLSKGEFSLRKLGIKSAFRLHPPRKGFGRKGIKTPFSIGGALGNRGEKINLLIARMI